MAANKVKGVRAAQAWDPWIAESARRWNDANVLALSLKRTAPDVAVDCVKAFLSVAESDPDERETIALIHDLYGSGRVIAVGVGASSNNAPLTRAARDVWCVSRNRPP